MLLIKRAGDQGWKLTRRCWGGLKTEEEYKDKLAEERRVCEEGRKEAHEIPEYVEFKKVIEKIFKNTNNDCTCGFKSHQDDLNLVDAIKKAGLTLRDINDANEGLGDGRGPIFFRAGQNTPGAVPGMMDAWVTVKCAYREDLLDVVAKLLVDRKKRQEK